MSDEIVRKVRIRNAAGLHARPCHAIVTTAREFESELFVSADGSEVNGKSILELMTLCAPCESWISFRAAGKDAEVLVARLAALVEAGFHESD
ncbi:MAG: HPr family phosphocarrier protein [Planctomycetes bacterium]|nr:HPr family phosphocarrier protein [Planctomycetota bacterium]